MTPKVSVSLITYNHAPFIGQAIESVLAQRTSFPFELIIGEDDSTDGTREIVKRYAEKYPDIIRAHFHSRASNLVIGGRPTGRRNLVENLRAARGTYIALLDGDDYWTDPEKLQRQVDFLEAHPECSTCFHRVAFVDETGAPLATPLEPVDARPIYTVDDFLRGEFFARTATVVYRRGLFGELPDWYFQAPVGDFPLNVLNGLHGHFGFLDRNMAVYRQHAGGIWSVPLKISTPGEQRGADERRAHQLLRTAQLYEILLPHLEGEHARAAAEALAGYRHLATHVLRHLHDWPALREVVWKLLRSRPYPPGARFPELCLLLLEGYLPQARRFTGAALHALARLRGLI